MYFNVHRQIISPQLVRSTVRSWDWVSTLGSTPLLDATVAFSASWKDKEASMNWKILVMCQSLKSKCGEEL